MIILNTSYNIYYAPTTNIRKVILNNEEELLRDFLPCNILPIPDDMPAEIPRAILTTKNQHSTLSLSFIGCSLATNYDDKFNNDIDKCLEYLGEKAKTVYKVVELLETGSIRFQGFTIQAFQDELAGDPVDFLWNKKIGLKSTKKPHDIESKSTFIVDERYYVNISISNVRLVGSVTHSFINPMLITDKMNKLGIIAEVNDRLSYNSIPDYTTTENETDVLLEQLKYTIVTRLENFVKSGEVLV